MKTLRNYLTSIVLLVAATPAVAESWVVESQADWTAARGAAKNVELADGFAEPKADKASFQSVVKTFPTNRKLSSVVFEQSPVWDNWEQIDDITPPGAGNAYVFLPVAPGDYYFFATRTWPQMEYPEGLTRQKRTAFRQEWKKNHPRGYHAWHSTDLKDWKLLGLVCPSSCMTTAEYADEKFYLYYDNPNDENPHLIVDDDLTDGVLGKEYGEVFSDPSHGSDAGVFRDEDGTFHMIYEDWSPINARENGWDSPLAGRVSSPDGIKGFKYGEHPPAVDHRTKPTGKIGTFTHPAMKTSNNGKPLEYEIHEPKQNAYGDWTLIKVGSHYHLFGDCKYGDENHLGSNVFQLPEVEMIEYLASLPGIENESAGAILELLTFATDYSGSLASQPFVKTGCGTVSLLARLFCHVEPSDSLPRALLRKSPNAYDAIINRIEVENVNRIGESLQAHALAVRTHQRFSNGGKSITPDIVAFDMQTHDLLVADYKHSLTPTGAAEVANRTIDHRKHIDQVNRYVEFIEGCPAEIHRVFSCDVVPKRIFAMVLYKSTMPLPAESHEDVVVADWMSFRKLIISEPIIDLGRTIRRYQELSNDSLERLPWQVFSMDTVVGSWTYRHEYFAAN